MAYASLVERVGRLEGRLSRVEAALAGPEPEDAMAEVPAERDAPPPAVVEAAAVPEATPPRDDVDGSPIAGAFLSSVPVWGERLVSKVDGQTVDAPSTGPVPAAIPYARPAPGVVRPPVLRHASLEQAIGLKVAGWAGAVAVVAAVGWAIQWAYVNGYFAAVPPAVRVALLAVAGGGLIVAGEWVYRRVNVLSATGLYGAGIAVLFVASYAGYAYYDLYGPHAAFALLAASAAVGAAVARRGNMVTIAVLSLLGGNLAPLLVRSATPPAEAFLFYLWMLQVVALTLSLRGREPKWWALRGLSLATTSAWVACLLGTPSVAASPLTPAFLLMYAALFQGELIGSALTRRVATAGPGSAEAERADRGASAVFSLSVTAALVAGLLVHLAPAGAAGRLPCILGVAVAAGGLAAACRRGRHPATDLLAVGYAVQAAALLVVAVPVAVGGVWVSIGWAGLAVAFSVLGRVSNLRSASLSAPVIWMLAVADLTCWVNGAFGPAHASDLAFTLGAVVVPTYAVMAWGLAAVGHVIARAAGAAGERDVQRIMSVVAGSVWVVASLCALPPLGATVTLLAYAVAVAADGLLGGGAGLVPQAALILAIATAKWVLVDTLADPLGSLRAVGTGLLDPAAPVGLALAAAVGGAYHLRDRWLPRGLRSSARFGDRLFAGAGLVVAMLVAWALSVEAVRAAAVIPLAGTGFSSGQWTQLLITACWAAAIGGYLAARAWPASVPITRRAAALHAAAVLPTLLALKFAIVDADVFGGATGRAVPLLNPRAAVAAVVLALLAAQRLAGGRAALGTDAPARQLPLWTAVALALVAGSFEVHQAFVWLGLSGASGGLPEHVALSIFWATFAVAAILAGFQLRTAGLRYFGLSLFAVTLLKVLFVDLDRVDSGGRVLSFLAVGLMLLGTSVLYGKVSPNLLGNGPAGDGGRNPTLGGP